MGECRVPEECRALVAIGHQVGQNAKDIEEERRERRENEQTIFRKLDSISDKVSDVWKVLLLALIPLTFALLGLALK